MSKIRFQLLFVMALTLSGSVLAKCPTGSVTVHGRVDNLPPDAAGAEVTVELETSKGNVSKAGSISNGEFTVEVSFSTWSSSFLGGDRCHNVPTVVEVKVVAAGKIYAQKRIPFKDSFEMYSPFLYRLKQDLSFKDGNGLWSSKRGDAPVGPQLPIAAQSQSTQETARLTYQLYSWEDANGGWNFSVLHDTNRQKTIAEVFSSKATSKGLERLKRKLSEMPEASRLVWFDGLTAGGVKVKGSESLKYPPDEVVAQVRQFAEARKIELVGPPTPAAP